MLQKALRSPLLQTRTIKTIMGHLALLCAACCSLGANANETDPHKNPWQSATHFGFGLTEPSNIHRKARSGSVLFLDLKRQQTKGLQLGLRTAALGSQGGSSEYYRLTSGPLLTVRLSSDWSLESSLGWFRESGEKSTSKTPYQSQGWSWMAGWQKKLASAERWTLSVGGFIGQHWGEAHGSPNQAFIFNDSHVLNAEPPVTNSTWWRGIDFALHVTL